jgi:hypothetical protein
VASGSSEARGSEWLDIRAGGHGGRVASDSSEARGSEFVMN